MNKGWRTYQASSAKVYHIIDDDGMPFCGAKKVALTSAMIDAAPRAWPPLTIKKLLALPICDNCAGRQQLLDDVDARPTLNSTSHWLIGALRKRIASLEAELQEWSGDSGLPE